jgi:hypothetical protein
MLVEMVPAVLFIRYVLVDFSSFSEYSGKDEVDDILKPGTYALSFVVKGVIHRQPIAALY